MTDPLMSDAELVRRLGLHPELRNQIESLILAVQDETGELKTADAAEMRVREVIRRTGHDALQAWATHQVEKTSQEVRQSAGVWRKGKNSAGTPPSETSALKNPNIERAQEGFVLSHKTLRSATAAAHARCSA